MALTRKFLAAMGIEGDKIDQIIEAHTESTDALKADRDKYRQDTESLVDIQEKLKDAEKRAKDAEKKVEEALKNAEENESYKEKYDAEHQAFEEYKQEIEAEKLNAKKTDAYKELLKKANVSDKRFDAIVKVTSMDDIEFDENGEVKDSDKLIENIKENWSEFIVKNAEEGVQTPTPPNNTGGNTMTKEEIFNIKDRNERQKAISENHELFGY